MDEISKFVLKIDEEKFERKEKMDEAEGNMESTVKDCIIKMQK